jgi:hypothetical protein
VSTKNRDLAAAASVNLQDSRDFYKVYSLPGAVSVASGTANFYVYETCTLININAYAGTAPAGSSLNITINKNGTSAKTISIADGSSSSTNSDTTTFAQGDYITVDVTQVGSSTAGSDVKINFIFRKT